jgi:ribosomal protein S18 acetylase RimI-like enzyme
MITIVKTGTEGIPLIQDLSHLIWPETYRRILTAEQISYMLEMMYSDESLTEQINLKHHQFIIAYDDNKPVAFSSYGLKPDTDDVFRLHKLYILPGLQGKGIGKLLIRFIINDIKDSGIQCLELNVNKHNPAIGFYRKLGFNIIREENIEIGGRFFVDDYIMAMPLPGLIVT